MALWSGFTLPVNMCQFLEALLHLIDNFHQYSILYSIQLFSVGDPTIVCFLNVYLQNMAI